MDTQPLAVVTGATSGIGEAFARRLARDGFDLIVHGRRRDRLELLASDLHERHGSQVRVIIADLAHPQGLGGLEALLSEEVSPEMLINNAGFTHLHDFLNLDLGTIEDMIAVHVVALTRLTRAVLPGMVERGRGVVINVSSDGVFNPVPNPVMTVYAATKAYVNTFTRALHSQVVDRGVHVQALCPGFVRSEILERHGISFDDWEISKTAVMSAEDQVSCSLAGLALGEIVCVPTLSDSTLLDQADEINDIIRKQSSGTGIPAERYVVRPSRP